LGAARSGEASYSRSASLNCAKYCSGVHTPARTSARHEVKSVKPSDSQNCSASGTVSEKPPIRALTQLCAISCVISRSSISGSALVVAKKANASPRPVPPIEVAPGPGGAKGMMVTR